MIISVLSPHSSRNGNTVSSILLSLALANLKRKVFLTHTQPLTNAYHTYLGLSAYEDKTTTPSQLVQLMGEGAIQVKDVGDYCTNFDDYLDVFVNNTTNFTEEDMKTFLEFILTAKDISYDYRIFDIDTNFDEPITQYVLGRSDIVILNVSPELAELIKFNDMKEQIIKACRGKKVILLCSTYDSRAVKKTKDISRYLGVDTTCYAIRYNSWVKWACNNGKLHYLYTKGKAKDSAVIDVYKDASSLATTVAKTKIMISRKNKGVFK